MYNVDTSSRDEEFSMVFIDLTHVPAHEAEPALELPPRHLHNPWARSSDGHELSGSKIDAGSPVCGGGLGWGHFPRMDAIFQSCESDSGSAW